MQSPGRLEKFNIVVPELFNSEEREVEASTMKKGQSTGDSTNKA